MLEQISKALATLLEKGFVTVKGTDKQHITDSVASILHGQKCDYKVIVGTFTDLIKLFE